MWAFALLKSNFDYHAGSYAQSCSSAVRVAIAAGLTHKPALKRVQDMVEIALFQPDIPQNCGAILRLAACLGVTTHIIGPTGFDLSDRALRRAGLDYLDRAALLNHTSWAGFEVWRGESRERRLVLATTKADLSYSAFAFAAGDLLLFGRESAGVPDDVHETADARVLIPIVDGLRSLNVATAAAMILGEALRQTAGFPSAGRRAKVLL